MKVGVGMMCLMVSGAAFATGQGDMRAAIDALVHGENSYRSVAGVSLDGNTKQFYAAGQDAINEQSIVEVGSITKVFTALMLAVAVEEGNLSLSTSPNAALGEDRFPPALDRELTLAQFANHTSGLPRLPDNLPSENESDPYAGFDLPVMREYLASLSLRDPMPQDCTPSQQVDPNDYSDLIGRTLRRPRQCYNYSNIGSSVLGHAVAAALDSTYEMVLESSVLDPLAMTDSGLEAADGDRLITGHLSDSAPARGWELGAIEPAGGLKSTPADMAKFLRAYLKAHAPDARTIVARAMRLTTSHLTDVDAGGSTIAVGLGWHTQRRQDGSLIFWHNGATDGFSAFMAIDPAQQRALFLVSNQLKYDADGNVDSRLTQTGLNMMLEPQKPIEK